MYEDLEAEAAAPIEGPIDPAPEPVITVPEAGVTYDFSSEVGISFDLLATAFFYQQERFNPDPVGREFHRQAYFHRNQAFVEKFGAITNEYFCSDIVAAVVLTDQDRILSVSNEAGDDASSIVQLLTEADRLEIEVRQNLAGEALSFDRRTLLEMTYSLYANALALLDRTSTIEDPGERAKARDESTRSFQGLKHQLSLARAHYERAGQRTAQISYTRGMLYAGAAIFGLSIIGAITLANRFPRSNSARTELAVMLTTFTAGATGAVISVMSRITFGRLKLDHSVGWTQIRRLGYFRPIIGAILGVAFYVLVAGDVLPLAAPEDATSALYFYTGFAFLAGFSERFAQDMLSSAKDRLSAGVSEGSEGSDPPATQASAPPT